ncbi:MAG TPA: alpha/beta fold hydrolase [Cyclobacteriaceae bacterium]|nr:alpha/beta hydrolase [Cyclobacteriaceae bacterium]HRK55373.1 alpha/beta fold hydrolase [Cyclobacteriaceae bacterium]
MKIIERISLWVTMSIVVALILIVMTISFSGCSKETIGPSISFNEIFVDVGTHNLKSFSYSNGSNYLVVFESGLGDDHGVWNVKDITGKISNSADVLLYDRAGYGGSGESTGLRGIDRLSTELNLVIDQFANNRKVILVGHSLGGMIIRDFAIKYPSKTAALLFVDTSHELFNNLTQPEEDMIYKNFKDTHGTNFGGTLEAKELIENTQYMQSLPSLPDVPVVVLTSMLVDAQHDAESKQRWYNSHENLKEGVSDFTHITTTKSGHYIQIQEPQLVIENIMLLISKL